MEIAATFDIRRSTDILIHRG